MQNEIRLRCLGDATPASWMVPVGVLMIGRLRAVDQFGFKQASGPGWRIEAKVENNLGLITIWSDSQQESASCPSYMSGMVQYGAIVSRYAPETGAPVSGLWAFSPSSLYAQSNNLPSGWQVGRYGQAVTTELSGAPNYTTAGTSPPAPWEVGGWTQCALLKPGLYSGRMRQVVQILLGSDTPVPYDYKFSRTHGVFRAKNGGRQEDWLVEISQANGVLAMQLPACRSKIPDGNTLGYVPTGVAFPTGDALEAGIVSGKVLVLMPPHGLAEVYEKTPFSPIFGWAFNYDGTKASCVVSALDDQYTRTFLYTLNISLSGASLALEQSGLVVCDKPNSMGYSTASFKVPQLVGGFAYQALSGPNYGTYAPQNCSAPLHVWYAMSGEMKVVRFESSVKVYGGRPADERRINGRPVGTPKPADSTWMSGDKNLGIEFIEYADSIGGETWEQVNQRVYVEGHKPPNDMSTPARYTYKALATSDYIQRLTLFGPTPFDSGVQIATIKLARLWTSTQNGYIRLGVTSVVIPSFEREAALSYSYQHWNTGSETNAHFTYDVVGKSNSYEGEGDWYKPGNLDPDGLPNTGKEECPNPATEDLWQVPAFPLNDEPYASGSIGAWVKGEFGGFSGNYGSSDLPASFSWRDGWPDRDSDTVLSPLLPLLYGSGWMYGKYSGVSKKVLHCASGAIDLELESGETYYFADAVRTADFLFTNIEGFPAYFLIQSWDGSLRYSPSKLTDRGFSKSDFGEYSPISEFRSELINFVGDA